MEPSTPDRWKVSYSIQGSPMFKDNFYSEQSALDWAKSENLHNLCPDSLDIFRYTVVDSTEP